MFVNVLMAYILSDPDRVRLTDLWTGRLLLQGSGTPPEPVRPLTTHMNGPRVPMASRALLTRGRAARSDRRARALEDHTRARANALQSALVDLWTPPATHGARCTFTTPSAEARANAPFSEISVLRRSHARPAPQRARTLDIVIPTVICD
jgi:hypothetical protein